MCLCLQQAMNNIRIQPEVFAIGIKNVVVRDVRPCTGVHIQNLSGYIYSSVFFVEVPTALFSDASIHFYQMTCRKIPKDNIKTCGLESEIILVNTSTISAANEMHIKRFCR